MNQHNGSKSPNLGTHNIPVQPGDLDGFTIMRYAHLYRGRTSGGVEQYLRHLDRGLLQRHELTVLQMYLTTDETNDAISVEQIGRGRILWVPVPVLQTKSTLLDMPKRLSFVYGRGLGARQSIDSGQPRALSSPLLNLLSNLGGYLRYKTTILSGHLLDLLIAQKVDLLTLHWFSYDTDSLISRARKSKVPFVFINHFENTRLMMHRPQKWIPHAAGIGTVSCQGIPDDLRARCVNLSDAVDSEFFTPENARPIASPEHPVVLLPARIGDGKGHRDMLEAARILKGKKNRLRPTGLVE